MFIYSTTHFSSLSIIRGNIKIMGRSFTPLCEHAARE